MNYSELSRVADTLDGRTSKVSGRGLEVQEAANPLDALEIKSEKKKIQESKVLILDNNKIISLLEGPRDEKRKFLSKLTDSQRRKVLQLYQDLKKVKDDSFAGKLELHYLDESLSNFIFTPTPYIRSILEETLNRSKYSSTIQQFVKLFLDDNYDAETSKDLLDAYVKEFKEAGLEPKVPKVLSSLEFTGTEAPEDSDLVSLIESEVSEVVESWDGNNFSHLIEVSEEYIDSLVREGHDYEKVSEIYWDIFSHKFEAAEELRFEDSVKARFGKSVSEILDKKTIDDAVEEALNVIHDKELIDESEGNEPVVEDKSIVTLLSEALISYAEGDPSQLDALVAQSEEVEEPTESEEIEESEVTLKDALRIAKAILKGEEVNKIVDRWQNRIPAFTKYNFRVSDNKIYQEIEPTMSIDIPLTCEEYNACVPHHDICFENSVKALNTPGCMHITGFHASEDGLCLIVNNTQAYYPISKSVGQICSELEITPLDQRSAFITENCRPLDDVLKLAACTDNLNILDNRFYKKHLKDKHWTFDSTPHILKGIHDGPGKLRFCADSDVTDGVVSLLGQKYYLE